MGRTARIFQWSLVVLIIINVAIVAIMYIGKNKEERTRPGEALIEQLNFNKQQTEAYEKSAEVHFKRIHANREQMREAKNALFNAVSDDLNQNEVNDLIKKIGDLEQELDLLTYYHFKEVYKLCKGDQKSKFKEFLNDIMHTKAHHGPPPPGGKPPHERGGHHPPPPH